MTPTAPRVGLALLALTTPGAMAAPPAADGPGDANPLRHWDVTALRLDITVDPDARTVAGTATLDVVPLALPGDTLRLDQVGLRIDAVTVDGAPVPRFRVDDDAIVIPLDPSAPHTVAVTYAAHPETGVHFRDGDGPHGVVEAWTQGEDTDNRYWFPGWDHPTDTFPVTTTLTVPDGLHAVANGVLTDTQPAAARGWTRWTYTLPEPIVTYLVAFAVGDYAVFRDEGPMPSEILVPRGTPEATARAGLGLAPDIGAYLADLLGHPYPYGVYRQVAVQRFLYGGMENASTTVLADTLLARDPVDDLGNTERVVAHELAHQWFGDLLTTKGWSELWLNEGFATYYAARWAEHALGEEAYADQVWRWADGARGTTSPMARRAWSAPGASPYTAQYVRGATVLHMLRCWLGTDAYDAAIRAYVAEHAHDLVETADLRQAFEQVTGNDLRWFFDPLVHGWGAPAIESRWREADGQLTVTLTQSGDVPAWRGPVRVDWGTADGAVHTAQLWLDGGTTRLVVPADDVAWVAPDPVGGVLARWTRTQDPKAWAAQLADAPTAFARMLALEALGDPKGQPEVALAPLVTALRDGHRLDAAPDPTRDAHPLATRAAASLGRLGTPEARDALLAALADPATPAAVRSAVVEALGDARLEPAVRDALAREVRLDPVPAIAGRALASLARVQPSAALAAARGLLGGSDPTFEGQRTAAALRVVGDHGDAGDLPRLLRWTDDHRRNVQQAAGQAAVDLARGDDATDARREAVARALVPWLDSADLRTRSYGITLLSRLGQPVAIPALQAVVAQSTLPDHRQAARAAIIQIRATAGSNEDPDALVKAQATIEALQQRLDELAERVEKLEAW
ncbi:MAG: M1 family metallopeptidase [Alphaproteobacteria bacterium]|nr:M1 family metallopeptidase [Alphaproteobacteria bacterium]